MKIGYLAKGVGLAAVVALGAIGSAGADEWFVLGQKTIKSMDPNAEIKAEEGKMWKEDIKKTKITVEGADVEITKVVLHWNNARDDTITNIGVVKSGGSTPEKDAPGHEATLMSLAIEYKIVPGGAMHATVKIWGYD